MINAKFDGFDFQDYLEEFIDQVESMLTTGLTVLCVFLNGSDNTSQLRLKIPTVYNLSTLV